MLRSEYGLNSSLIGFLLMPQSLQRILYQGLHRATGVLNGVVDH